MRQNKLFGECFLVVVNEQWGIGRQNGSDRLSGELQGHFSSPSSPSAPPELIITSLPIHFASVSINEESTGV